MMKKQYLNTMRSRLTTSYFLVLLAMMLSIGGIAIFLVGYELFTQLEKQADNFYHEIREGALRREDMSLILNQLAPANQSDILLRLGDLESENTQWGGPLIETERHHFFNPFLIVSHQPHTYFKLEFDVLGEKLSVYQNIDDQFQVIEMMVNTLLVVVGVGIGFSFLIISSLAKKINEPLQAMTKEINSAPNRLKVTVPAGPQELTELSQAFNHLGELVEERIERERRFLSDVSHELKTPLAAIRGHLNLIKRRSASHPEILETSLSFIDEESLRLQGLIEQILLTNRLENTKHQAMPVDFSELVQRVVQEYKTIIKQELTSTIQEGIHIEGNQDQLRQIVISLMDNAQKYTPLPGKVHVQLHKKNQMATLEISDTGIGIPDGEKNRVFERFYQVDPSRNSKSSGNGLGLAITKQLVELNGGSISVKDHLPQGSTFVMEILTSSENSNKDFRDLL